MRKTEIAVLTAIAALILLLLAGCAGANHFDRCMAQVGDRPYCQRSTFEAKERERGHMKWYPINGYWRLHGR